MFEYLEELDKNVLLSINSKHTNFFDVFMFYASDLRLFFPFYFLWIAFLLKQFQLKKTIIVFVMLGLLVLLADQSASQTKRAVKRYRPTYNTELTNKIHTVNEYRGGEYGFFSSHASNTFGIAVLLMLLFNNKSWWFKSQFIFWAMLITYTRLYLGVHYPSDVLVGALVGMFWGVIVYKITNLVFKKYGNEVSRS